MEYPYVFKRKWKCWVISFFDFLGRILTCCSRRNFDFKPFLVKKILVTRIDHLGDALLLRPALLALRRAQPHFEIHLLTPSENAPVFQLDPFIDRVLTFDNHWFRKKLSFGQMLSNFLKLRALIRSERYDAFIDFRGDLRSNALAWIARIPIRFGYGITGGGWMLTHEKHSSESVHQVFRNLTLLSDWGVPNTAPDNPRVYFPANIPSQMQTKLAGFEEQPYALIHAGAGNPLKEWPWNSFVELANHILRSKRVQIVYLIGTQDEKRRCPHKSSQNFIDLRGETDLHELAYLMQGAAFFIGNDSGPAHLAAAQGIPVLVIASSTNVIAHWHPWTKKLRLVNSQSASPAPERAVWLALNELLAESVQT